VAEEPDVDATVRRIENLLDELGRTGAGAREVAEETIRALMRLYGAGLGRIVGSLPGPALEQLAEDRLVGSLLLLHGMHPVDAETRVRKALRRVERRLESHQLALVSLEDGVARIRVERSNGRAAPAGLGEAIEQSIAEHAPDLAGVEIDGLAALVQIALPAK
jgi:hypothetical protein